MSCLHCHLSKVSSRHSREPTCCTHDQRLVYIMRATLINDGAFNVADIEYPLMVHRMTLALAKARSQALMYEGCPHVGGQDSSPNGPQGEQDSSQNSCQGEQGSSKNGPQGKQDSSPKWLQGEQDSSQNGPQGGQDSLKNRPQAEQDSCPN